MPHYRSQIKQMKLFDERVSKEEDYHISLTNLPRTPVKNSFSFVQIEGKAMSAASKADTAF